MFLVTGNRIPSLRALIRSLSSSSRAQIHDPPPTSTLRIMLSNPFTSSPLFFCAAILSIALFMPRYVQQYYYQHDTNVRDRIDPSTGCAT